MEKSLYSINKSKIAQIIFVALLVLVLLPCVSYSQVYFREYGANNKFNDGRCIIRLGIGNDKYLHIGEYGLTAGVSSGHGIWTNANGTVNVATNYDRVNIDDDYDYHLTFIEDNTVNGSYNPMGPFTAYNGHPATGGRTYSGGAVLNPRTWTTIIDPISRDRKWDHIITSNDEDDLNVGVSLVRDKVSTNNFYVLSEIGHDNAGINPPILQKFGVSKYVWAPGNNGHQMPLSMKYSYEDYSLYPKSIVEVNNGGNYQLVVIGNAIHKPVGGVPQFSRIFACSIDPATLIPINFVVYDVIASRNPTVLWDGDIMAKSATGPYNNDHILIAGRATDNNTGAMLPLLFSIDLNLAWVQLGIYHFIAGGPNELNGEFNCVKEYAQNDGNGNQVNRVTAVGKIGERATYATSTAAFVMNASDMRPGVPGTGTPMWWTRQGTIFTDANSTITEAKWFVSAPDTTVGGNHRYMYTGYQAGNNQLHAISGAVLQTTGATECDDPFNYNETAYPEVDLNEPDIEYEQWGEDVNEPTVKYAVDLSPQKCVNDQISAGKQTSEEEPVTGMSNSTDNATFTVLENAINITYSSSQDASIELVLTDVLGNTITTMKFQSTSGTHFYTLDTKDLLTGSYYIAVITPTSRFNKNVIIVK